MSVDGSDLNRLAVDLASAPDGLPKFLAKALGVTSKKVKDSASKKVSGRRHFKQAAAAIDYELTGYSGATSGISSEIGYNKDRPAGRLGNLLEFGAPNAGNQLAPGGELQAAMNENAEDFERGVAAAAADALKEVGL